MLPERPHCGVHVADYSPLIARAIAGLDPSAPGESRRALYERARAALIAQLRSVQPPLSETEITRERLCLGGGVPPSAAQPQPQPSPTSRPRPPSQPSVRNERPLGQEDRPPRNLRPDAPPPSRPPPRGPLPRR